MRAMVFAAGLGARLLPLTHVLPKPAVPVANRPLAWFSLDYLSRNDFLDVVLNTHHLSNRLREKLEPHVPEGMRVRYVHEPVLLGTGGGLKNAWHPIDGESFVAVNSDVLFAPNLEAAMRHHQGLGAIATLVLREVEGPSTYGAVDVDLANSRVCGLLGVPNRPRESEKRYMFTGVHLLHPRAWKDLPDSGCIIRTAYRRWVDRGEVVGAYIDNSPWTDVGTLKAYLDTNCAFTKGQITWDGIKVDSRSVVSESATIGNDTQIDEAVIGKNARIETNLSLKRVVIWENAHVERSTENAIVTGTEIGVVAVEWRDDYPLKR
jgi:NDP-sugar pyrophosphorylase family protein